MKGYPSHLLLRLDPDDRLAAAAGGAARYFADASGATSEVIVEIQSAVLAACRHAFHLQHQTASSFVRFERTPDRLDIILEFPGPQSAWDLRPAEWPGIDEVRYDNADPSHPALRLTKKIQAPAE